MPRAKQTEIVFTRWGGPRRGAGRKPSGRRPRVTHVARPELAARHPLHVTLRVRDELPSLRGEAAARVVRAMLDASQERFGLRFVHFSAQIDHLHLVREAVDEDALARGMHAFTIRVARALNRLWKRKGSVFADRYHARALKTPREVRNALGYVLQNARKHGVRLATTHDPCSSASTFDGWRERSVPTPGARPLARPRTWLLEAGWKRHGLLSIRGP